MKIKLRTQEYSSNQRRALWWKYNQSRSYEGDPAACPLATREDCCGHLESVGHSEDDDLKQEWCRACEAYQTNSKRTSRDRDADILGKSFVVQSCEASVHNGVSTGCVCALVGKSVTLTKRYAAVFAGTASYHIIGSTKRVRLSELGLPNRMT